MGLSRKELMAAVSPVDTQFGVLGTTCRVWLLSISGMVERFHNIPTITRDTVGEHTYGVLWLVVLLSEPKLPSSNLFLATLAHDTPEANWGDITAPTKRILNISKAYKELENKTYEALSLKFELTHEEEHILKLADYMDGMLHCCYERAMGNTMVCRVLELFHLYVDQDKLTPHQSEILHSILEIWRVFDESRS